MNIRILAAAVALVGAGWAAGARADDRSGHGGGHWQHDARGSGGHDWRGGGGHGGWSSRGGGERGHWDRDGRGGGWDHDRGRWHEGWRHDRWPSRGYRGWGWAPQYSWAPRYHAPYYYAPGYYAPEPWGGWFDDVGVVIQFHLP